MILFEAEQWDPDSLAEVFGERCVMDAPSASTVTLLDTFDWRLHNEGRRLSHELSGRRSTLRWTTPLKATPYVLPTTRRFRGMPDIPDGFLRTEIDEIVGIRALLDMGTARVVRQNARIDDREGNTLVRLVIEQWTPLETSGKPAGPSRRIVTLQPLAVRGKKIDKISSALIDAGAVMDESADGLADAVELRGRRLGDYRSKPRIRLRPGRPAGDAARMIVAQLLATVRANVDGVIEDLDAEFLHDLRVACRRTRSALGQLKGVLDRHAVSELVAEIRWLGDVTNPCRDLDVYLLEMAHYREQLGDDARSLDVFERLLRRERSKALRRVRRALRSARFERLLEAWEELASNELDDQDAPKADRPIGRLAGKKILKAYGKMVHRGAALPNPPPPEDMHRLRIDAKKLRYLLEFFSSLYPKKTLNRLVKELKQFQDILGGFNDMVVQQHHLASFAEDLMAEGSATADTVFSMGRLADAMTARQDDYRRVFTERFEAFSSVQSQALYRETFGGDQ